MLGRWLVGVAGIAWAGVFGSRMGALSTGVVRAYNPLGAAVKSNIRLRRSAHANGVALYHPGSIALKENFIEVRFSVTVERNDCS